VLARCTRWGDPPEEDMTLHPALGIIARRATKGQSSELARPASRLIIDGEPPIEEIESRYFERILARLRDLKNN
jgi:hypothetical protein